MTRGQKKEITRSAILKAARQVFKAKGFLSSNTQEVAKGAGIAHGTLFLHFKSKDELVNAVLQEYLMELSAHLEEDFSHPKDFFQLLDIYLVRLSTEEPFLSMVLKELPFYSEKIRRFFFFKESGIRKYFFDAYQKGVQEERYRDLDITELLLILFGSIQSILLNRDYLSRESAVELHRKKFLEFFKKLMIL